MKNLKNYCIILIFSAIIASCSSAPKRTMQISSNYQKASNRYEKANAQLITGEFNNAGANLSQAYDIAVCIDSEELLCKICLSAVVYKSSAKESAQFFTDKTESDLLKEAKQYASYSENNLLLQICKIYEAKIFGTEEYIKELESIEKNLSKEPFYQGYLFRTLGDLYSNKKDYATAAVEYKKAAEIHTKNRYLYEVGLDWYYAARSYSLAGNKKEAVSAIKNALKYDRDAENSAAIASDYKAYAQILSKHSPSQEEALQAERAMQRHNQIMQILTSSSEQE